MHPDYTQSQMTIEPTQGGTGPKPGTTGDSFSPCGEALHWMVPWLGRICWWRQFHMQRLSGPDPCSSTESTPRSLFSAPVNLLRPHVACGFGPLPHLSLEALLQVGFHASCSNWSSWSRWVPMKPEHGSTIPSALLQPPTAWFAWINFLQLQSQWHLH